jgi:PelA/Pel-15E family pectate lyase
LLVIVLTRQIYFASLLLPALVCSPASAEEKSRQWNSSVLKHDDAWYRSDEAHAIATAVMLHQASDGGWPKSVNLAVPPSKPRTISDGKAKQLLSTFDNDGTTLPLQFLARMISASSEFDYRLAFYRGLDFTLAAQYPNGGWPQYFPLRKGYYSHITFNDNAMIRVMTLLRDVSLGEGVFSFVDDDHKKATSIAVQKGIECILRTQVKQRAKLTAWCAQYDAVTLQPTWARAYEPPSLSGAESVGIVRFLMEIKEPTPEVKASVEGAIEWLQSVAIKGVRYEEFRNSEGKKDRRIVKDPTAEPLWARFYELETNRPIFLDRDSIIRYDIAEIDYERRSGYSYYGDWPANILTKNYPRWKSKSMR